MGGVREFIFVVGPETDTQPTAGTPTQSTDLTTKTFVESNFANIPTVSGSEASPNSITAAGGITGPSSGEHFQAIFVAGNGGAIDITANPQITAGTVTGLQRIVIFGTSNTNTVKLDDSNGLSINGPVTLGAEDSIELLWNGTVWREIGRNA